MTVREALEGAARELAGAGIENGQGEAEILLGRLLARSRADLYLEGNRDLDTSTVRTLAGLLMRRRGGEPIQYVVGEAAFRDLILEVGRGVFIPRPETELLVDEVLAFLGGRTPAPVGSPATVAGSAAPRVLECGTGSGAIALALAQERIDLRVVATELSPRAMQYARRNLARSGLGDRVTLVQCDLADALAVPAERRFDALVANPPYVAESERPLLPREVLDHEPDLALFSPGDGLVAIARLVAEGPRLVAPGGLVALEVGEAQGDTVQARFDAHAGYAEARVCLDLAGKARMVLARIA